MPRAPRKENRRLSSVDGLLVFIVWKVEIYESSLEDCDVKEVSDIENIEFTIVIRYENWSNKKEGEISLKLR